jgi:hypothetical protein
MSPVRNPPRGILPIFLSQNDAFKSLADNQRQGLIERCAHLSPGALLPLSVLLARQAQPVAAQRSPCDLVRATAVQVKVALILVPVVALAILFHVVKDLITLARTLGEIWHGK